MKDAVRSGYWPLYRFSPSDAEHGTPFHLDSKAPAIPVAEFVATEARFAVLARTHPERAAELGALLQADADERWRYYSQLATIERTVPHARRSTSTAVDADAGRRHGRTRRMTDLTTRYLGLELRTPIVASAGPLTGDVDDGPPARRRRRLGHRPAVAVRGGDPPRRGRSSTSRSRPGSEHFAEALDYFPDAASDRLPVAGRPPPRPPRGRAGGRRRPRHRQRERHVVGQLDPLRRAARRRRRIGDRAERVRRRRRRVPVGRRRSRRTTSPSSPTSAPRSTCRSR